MSFQGSRTINTANLIEVQRGIITESTDRGQLHQRIILGTFDCFSIMESKQEEKIKNKKYQRNKLGNSHLQK